jgi:hypothetical protein
VSVLQEAPGVKQKARTTTEAGVEGQAGDTSDIGTVTVMRGGYYHLHEGLVVINQMAKPATSLRLRTLWALYVEDTLETIGQHTHRILRRRCGIG